VPIATQTAAEHRMYLPLAAIAALVVLAGARRSLRWSLAAGTVVAALLGLLTWQRNQVYRSSLDLWQDTVAKVPANSRAHNNLGLALMDAGRHEEALQEIAAALELRPRSEEFSNNFALALANTGHLTEALELIEEVIVSAPGLAAAHDTRALVLERLGRTAEALDAYRG